MSSSTNFPDPLSRQPTPKMDSPTPLSEADKELAIKVRMVVNADAARRMWVLARIACADTRLAESANWGKALNEGKQRVFERMRPHGVTRVREAELQFAVDWDLMEHYVKDEDVSMFDLLRSRVLEDCTPYSKEYEGYLLNHGIEDLAMKQRCLPALEPSAPHEIEDRASEYKRLPTPKPSASHGIGDPPSNHKRLPTPKPSTSKPPATKIPTPGPSSSGPSASKPFTSRPSPSSERRMESPKRVSLRRALALHLQFNAKVRRTPWFMNLLWREVYGDAKSPIPGLDRFFVPILPCHDGILPQKGEPSILDQFKNPSIEFLWPSQYVGEGRRMKIMHFFGIVFHEGAVWNEQALESFISFWQSYLLPLWTETILYDTKFPEQRERRAKVEDIVSHDFERRLRSMTRDALDLHDSAVWAWRSAQERHRPEDKSRRSRSSRDSESHKSRRNNRGKRGYKDSDDMQDERFEEGGAKKLKREK